MQLNTSDFETTYDIYEEIGKGGGGVVYRAFHKRLKKEVVIKKIHENFHNVNVRNEADILKNLKSPYLPQVYDFFEYNGGVYTVMEYIEGKSMKQCIDEGMQFYQSDILRWFRQLSEALILLHAQEPPIIHGDIKPANIMLIPTGDICLIDFNISRSYEENYDNVLGYTPAYAAPEVMTFSNRSIESYNSNTKIDTRADIYSLGATMYHIITGRHIDKKNPVDVRKLVPGIYETLSYIVMKCIRINPIERYQSARELFDAINSIYTSTQSFRVLIRHQIEIRILLIIMTLGSCVLLSLGMRRIMQEREVAYNSYVKKEAEARATGNEKVLEEAFNNALNISQMSADAYIEKGWYIYDCGRYDEAITFLLDEAVPYINDDWGLSNIYYLIGKCYVEQEEYAKAHDMFRSAVQVNSKNSNVFQEESIIMARVGKVDEARKYLSTAKKYGLDVGSISYSEGEIALSENNNELAKEKFENTIHNTDDEYLKMRSYITLSHIFKEEGINEDSINNRIHFLSEAMDSVGDQYKYAIVQELSQAYIDRYSIDKNDNDALQAILLLQQVIDSGYGNYDTYQTIGTLYHNTKRYDEEESEWNLMLQLFGEDYRTYMHYAYLEASKQNQIVNAARDYKKFADYYDKAISLYGKQKKDNQSDPLMDNLSNVYQDVKNGGWL